MEEVIRSRNEVGKTLGKTTAAWEIVEVSEISALTLLEFSRSGPARAARDEILQRLFAIALIGES